jgi:hypothetical protein
MAQLHQDARLAGTEWPVIIAQRDHRVPIIIVPVSLISMYKSLSKDMPSKINHLRLSSRDLPISFEIMRLDDFLKWIKPEFFKQLVERE